MTPEERARTIPAVPGCRCHDHELCAQHQQIADAIRAAVAEAHDVCAQAAEQAAAHQVDVVYVRAARASAEAIRSLRSFSS